MERNEISAKLVKQAIEGDSSAFEELYQSTYKSVFFHAQKILKNEQDVEDAVSETYVRAYENLSKLQDPALFQAWVNRIVTNLSMNMVRDDRYREGPSLDDDHQYAKWWILRDVNSYKDSIFRAVVASFGYDCGEYEMSRNDSFQISEDEFPQFYQQVSMIVGTGSMFDSYDQTISYKELIGNETLDPGFAEYGVEFDWGKETHQPYDCALYMRYDGTMYTLPFADDIVIHRFCSDADEIGGLYFENVFSFEELNKDYSDKLTNENDAFYGETMDAENANRRLFALGPRSSREYVQIKNGEIIALWIEGP